MLKKHWEPFGESILVKYTVKLTGRAFLDIDSIYKYISETLCADSSAISIVAQIEEAIFSLETLPNRGAIRKIGKYANKDYRNIFVENYVIVYKVDEDNKRVIIMTVRYARSNF